MFGTLRLIFTLLICIVIVGFYLGWFSFSNKAAPDPQTNKVNINVSVDKKKMDADLQTFEHKVAERIQDMNNPPQSNTPTPPSGRQPAASGMNLGPISIPALGTTRQPSGDPNALPPWSVGPVSLQPPNPAGQPNGQTAGQPQIQLQTPDFKFTVPLGPPPAGEGR